MGTECLELHKPPDAMRHMTLWLLHPEHLHFVIQGQIEGHSRPEGSFQLGPAILEDSQGWFFSRMVQGVCSVCPGLNSIGLATSEKT